MNYFLIFCGGFTFAVGCINFLIGAFYKKDRSYLFFGLLSLFASIFLIQQVINVFPDFSSIIFAVTFYGLFIWFIRSYTENKSKLLPITITVLVIIALLLKFLVDGGIISAQIWEIYAHATIISIALYGIKSGSHGNFKIARLWKIIYYSLMSVLLVTAIIVGLSFGFNIHIIYDMAGMISPLDFFPILFSIIIGYKMSYDILNSYQLEIEVAHKETRWSNLMESIKLLAVQLDCEGRVTWVNSFLKEFTGYSDAELVASNWFDLMIHNDRGKDLKNVFTEIIENGENLVFNNNILTKNQGTRNIQWSNLLLKDSNGNCSGVISIGADVTQLELALQEINTLKEKLEKENLLLKEEVKHIGNSTKIIGTSDTLKYVLKRALQVSTTDSTVLLEGETGVGKELFAQMIHENSLRKHKPFIKVNCASLPKELIESELFGHEKGAFTGAIKTRQGRFELADKGTLFLDEIGELPIELQPKLLRVLQSGEFERIGSEKTKTVDVRLIAATNRNLQEESTEGNFRQDLFFRLNVYPITIPPLRHRKDDIPMLIRHFTLKIGMKIGRKIKNISKADISKLQLYDWPGNVRELENVLERAIINSEKETIVIDENQLMSAGKLKISKSSESTLDATQKSHIISVLEACDWKINGESGAAQKLGMPPSTLRSKMKKLNINRPK